jgi:3-oxoacyl-[acyl-carrier-protein] synthase II
MRKSVVVTGLGAVTPFGVSLDEMWRAVCGGKSPIGSIDGIEGIVGPVAGATLPDFAVDCWVDDRKTTRLMDRATGLGVAAATLAGSDSGLNVAALDPARVGVFIGAPGRTPNWRQIFRAAIGDASDGEGFHLDRLGEGLDLVDPLATLKGTVNSVMFFTALKYNAMGPNCNLPSGGVSATLAIGGAFRAVQRGDVDLALAGGYESLFDADRIDMFRGARLLTAVDERGRAAHRSFDKRRDGFALSEGAAFLVLEDREHARRRGAKIYGEVSGYASASAPFDLAQHAPSEVGFERALRGALADAGCETADAVYAHGLATQASDRAETRAIKTVFGRDAWHIPVTAVKSMFGNTCAASGAIEAAVGFLSLRDSCVPPTVNRDEPDPECDLDYVAAHRARPLALQTIVLNNANLGGSHASLVLQRASRHV